MAGMIFWLDRKQSERLERMDRRIDDVQVDMREMQRDMCALNSKVDRMQGTLDVLVFGERVVPRLWRVSALRRTNG